VLEKGGVTRIIFELLCGAVLRLNAMFVRMGCMGRRRKGLRFKITNRVTLSVLGITFAVIATILLLSIMRFFFPIGEGTGTFLALVNSYLNANFGPLWVGIPFLLYLIAGFCFNSKRFVLVPARAVLGIAFFLIGSLGLFASGSVGFELQQSVFASFTSFGGVIVFLALLSIGVVLFLDLEPQTIVNFFASLSKGISLVADKSKTQRGRKTGESSKEDDDVFIQDTSVKKVEPAILDIPIVKTPIVTTKHPTSPPKEFPARTVSDTQKQPWVFPPLDLLHDIKSQADRGDTKANAAIIENTLRSFGIKAQVKDVREGPTVTQYCVIVAEGTNVQDIVKKAPNLALALASSTGTVRVEAPIPGHRMIGIEIPNLKSETVGIRRLLASDVFTKDPDPLLVPLGLDVSGQPLATSIAKMPHALIAGATGSGKSVCINAWLTTFLFRTRPSELRLILVDPKQVELTGYNGIPHLLSEVITSPQETIEALKWGIGTMEQRYQLLRDAQVRNIQGYNELANREKLPYIVYVIDELADLMMTSKSDIEGLIVRIAQKARAVGIHLVLATQRPSVNVITGLMKANIPCRIAFNVASGVDSKVILDTVGAETLVGKGDMFYSAADTPKPRRIQGPFVSEKEVNNVVNFLKSNNQPVQYTEEVTRPPKEMLSASFGTPVGTGDTDPLFNEALELIRGLDTASASLFQRRLKVGYARGARILDELAAAGYVGPAAGSKPREVLAKAKELPPRNNT
jgi:S-DNA-T family DNA segregation ATPase FtsK/SpoIIIE